jgi:transcriptional regulator with XRE-family HTH domain
VNVGSIGEYIRQQREQAKISLRQLASAAGVSNPYLSQIERGLRRPSAEILQQIAKGLRISAEALYVQAGILEDRRPDSGVRAAVLADPELTERQKQVLLEIYESFRRELVVGAPAGTGLNGAEPAALELTGPEITGARPGHEPVAHVPVGPGPGGAEPGDAEPAGAGQVPGSTDGVPGGDGGDGGSLGPGGTAPGPADPAPTGTRG